MYSNRWTLKKLPCGTFGYSSSWESQKFVSTFKTLVDRRDSLRNEILSLFYKKTGELVVPRKVCAWSIGTICPEDSPLLQLFQSPGIMRIKRQLFNCLLCSWATLPSRLPFNSGSVSLHFLFLTLSKHSQITFSKRGRFFGSRYLVSITWSFMWEMQVGNKRRGFMRLHVAQSVCVGNLFIDSHQMTDWFHLKSQWIINVPQTSPADKVDQFTWKCRFYGCLNQQIGKWNFLAFDAWEIIHVFL